MVDHLVTLAFLSVLFRLYSVIRTDMGQRVRSIIERLTFYDEGFTNTRPPYFYFQWNWPAVRVGLFQLSRVSRTTNREIDNHA